MKPCTCWAAFWANLGTLNACTARPDAQAARMLDVFMFDGMDQEYGVMEKNRETS